MENITKVEAFDCLPELCFSVFVAQVLVGLPKQFINHSVFSILAYATGFNNNNKT